MQVIKNNKEKNILTIVSCVHGDEVFGLDVFNYFKNKIEDYPGLKIILANEKALAKNKRFIESDLNRSFPGKVKGTYEERLAHELVAEMKGAKYILDIHTTTSDIVFTPIVSNLSSSVKRILNLCSSKEVALMSKEFTGHSLIGQFRGAASLEFNFEYASRPKALKEVVLIASKLLQNQRGIAKARRIFCINGIIDKKIKLPSVAKDFKLIKSLGFYPFLLNEKSYKNNQGFLANSVKRKSI